MIEIKENEKSAELKEKIIKEFLESIDFELCKISEDEIIVRDRKSSAKLNEVLSLPTDFNSGDNLRTFRCSKLDTSDYVIEALNAKYPDISFSKNGISGINLAMRKDEKDNYFLSQLFYENALYTTTIGSDALSNYIGYKVNNEDGIITIDYEAQEKDRKLRISIRQDIEKSICIQEKHIENNHTALLKIEVNHQEVYCQELEENEMGSYLSTLAFKASTLVQKANQTLKTLNGNLCSIVFSYYPITYKFMELMENACSNEEVEQLYDEYMNFESMKRSLNKPINTK